MMGETTMFDFSNFYDRMAAQMPSPCVVVEVGVADGESAIYLANKLHQLGKSFKLYMVDNLDYGGTLQLKKIYENIIASGLGEFIEILPFDSLKAASMFNGHSIDFVFLDSSHEYKETKDSLRAWYPLLKDEGIISGHDYDLYKGVKKAVDEVMPVYVTREDLYDENGELSQSFLPSQFLFTEKTEKGYGVYSGVKNFFIKLNQD